MAKPKQIELNDGEMVIPILYEDRSILALDKPAGWMLAPDSWDETGRNLQLALQSSINARDFWAQSRNLKYLRYVHRLDAETTGVTLFAKSTGALRAYSELFENREIEKFYLAVVHGEPKAAHWKCDRDIMPDPHVKGRMMIVPATGVPRSALAKSARSQNPEVALPKEARTVFSTLQKRDGKALIEARPFTGRTHQIRVHLAAEGFPVVGDPVYGPDEAAASKGRQKLALRAMKLIFRDPFQKRKIFIAAPMAGFVADYGFDAAPFGLHKPPADSKLPE